ncbi:hypothetical protein LCGC14_1483840 [marine sediment metagenome]|uniref:Uncharacterized protein n=1 Tax=marine sediment metagenome TaxID=412755 RepID=A0A0F9JUK9_9ZZZZ
MEQFIKDGDFLVIIKKIEIRQTREDLEITIM